MKTSLEVEGLLAPPPLSTAANDEFVSSVQPPSGWDPFEVWRTRVKAVAPEDLLKSAGHVIG
jgi:hypothetical protein